MSVNTTSDHDLLLQVDTKLDGLTTTVETFICASAEDRRHLWSNKVDKEIVVDHEIRLRRQERYLYIGLGGLGTIQLIVAILTLVKH